MTERGNPIHDGDEAELYRLFTNLGKSLVGVLIEASQSDSGPAPLTHEPEGTGIVVTIDADSISFRNGFRATPVSMPISVVNDIIHQPAQ